MAEARTLITASQLEGMSFPDERVELSEGELIRVSPTGIQHGDIGFRLARFLADFVDRHKLGAVYWSDVGFRLSEHTVRSPDISFVSRQRIESHGVPVGFWPGAPDLVVGIFSPSDSKSDLFKKIKEYFEAGTRLVWALFPGVKQVYVYHSPKAITVLEVQDVLSGEDVLLGFSLPVEKIFP